MVNFGIQLKSWSKATLRDPGQFFRPRKAYLCPCCAYEGHFPTAKKRVPIPFRCPNCESRPRDRQIALWLTQQDIRLSGAHILHFAPEWPLFRMLRHEPHYVGGDIIKRRNANARVDITDIQFPDNHFDVLICNHVLEHVPDDAKGMAECHRVMKPGALGLFSVPLSGKAETWEPSAGMSVQEIEAICGWDHKRLYGFDFADKLAAVGFTVSHFDSTPEDRERYCLLEERIFVVRKD